MFYISIQRKSKTNGGQAGGQVRYVGIPQQYAGLPSYYQIYENGRPLMNMHFATRQEARMRLKTLEGELRRASNGWYRVESKLSPYLSVGSVVGFKKVYGDGSSVDATYVIRKISLEIGNNGQML